MFRFSLRDVLWLMVVVGLGAGWFIDRMSEQATIATYRAKSEEFEAAATRLADERQSLRQELWQARNSGGDNN